VKDSLPGGYPPGMTSRDLEPRGPARRPSRGWANAQAWLAVSERIPYSAKPAPSDFEQAMNQALQVRQQDEDAGAAIDLDRPDRFEPM
jgi:hypothetical protein